MPLHKLRSTGKEDSVLFWFTYYFHDNKLFRRFALKKPFLRASHTMQLSKSDPIFNIMTPNTAPDQHKRRKKIVVF